MSKALIISGSTWVARKELKALGGWWNPATKVWVLPPTEKKAIESLATDLGLYVEESEVELPTWVARRSYFKAPLQPRA